MLMRLISKAFGSSDHNLYEGGQVEKIELPGSDPELVFTPAEIRHGDQLIQRENNREFFSDSPVTPHLNSSRETGSEDLFINTENIAH